MAQAALSVALGTLCLLADPAAPAEPVRKAGSAEPVLAAETAEMMLAEVKINGLALAGQFLVARRDGRFLVRGADLDGWRIRRAGIVPVEVDGELLVPLAALPGVAARFDEARQRLDLVVPAELFAGQRVSAAGGRVRPAESTFAAFFNYDLSLEYDDGLTGGAQLEGGLSDDWGLVASTMSVSRLAGSTRAVRLDTYFLRDDPDRLTRLVVGDTLGDARTWSRQIRFGGVRLGTEFAIEPGLITFPVPDFGGRAAVPSSVELLVNDALRYRTQVEEGPFSITQVPLVTGAGEVTLVVRDALGVERRVRTAYYVSPRLLRAGLSAWSLEAGAERRGYGLRSFGYGDAFAAGSFRRGLTSRLTAESRMELSGEVQSFGAGINMVWPAIGELGVAAAASHGDDGEGALYRVFAGRVTPDWSLAVSYQHATRDFDGLGIEGDRERIVNQLQASGGASLGRWGNVALAYTDLEYADRSRTRLTSANYSIGIADKGYLSLFALHSRIDDLGGDTTVGAGLTIPLGSRTSAYLQADSRDRSAELRRTPPTAGGWGYRLAASTGRSDRQQAAVQWRGDFGEAALEAARFGGDAGLRLLASGGLLAAGGRAYATRRIEQAVGIVEVPGQAGVRIFQENRPITRTDSRGRAVIPDLRPYEANRISLAPADLPIESRMADDTMMVVPRYRGAASARFAVAQDNPATILLRMPDGRAIDAGTGVRADDGEALFVGYGGEVFVQRLRPGMTLEVDVADGPCRVTVGTAATDEALPRIGPLTCAPAAEARP